MASDPFTQVYDAIVAEFVAAKFHVIDWNSSRDPETDLPTDFEFPEIQILPTGLSAQLGSNSCTSEVQRTYNVLVNSGDQRAWVLFNAEWRILNIMYKLKYGTLDALGFVNTVEVNPVQTGLSNAESNRGIKGWSSIWTIEVKMLLALGD